MAVGLFADPELAANAGFELLPDGAQLGVQFAGCGMILLWTGALSLLIFVPLKMNGLLRVDENTELQGLDLVEHKKRRVFGPCIYDHVILRETFFLYLDTAMVPEHAPFVRAVEDFKNMFSTNSEGQHSQAEEDSRRNAVEEICKTYINDGAPYQVNVSHDTLSNFKGMTKRNEYPKWLFDPMLKVLRTQVLDLLPNFNQSTFALQADQILTWLNESNGFSDGITKSLGPFYEKLDKEGQRALEGKL
jgi:hypothetical protein